MISLSLIGYTAILFIALLLFQAANHFKPWDYENYVPAFFFLFIILGTGFANLAFPAFRSKEKSMFYLMLPSSIFEKYILEFLVHIIGYIIMMPILFFTVAYLESFLIHKIIPDFEIFSFSGWRNIFLMNSRGVLMKNIGIENIFFVLLIFFAGASHFSKSPLLKTVLTIMIISVLFSFFSYFLKQFFSISSYQSIITWIGSQYPEIEGYFLPLILLFLVNPFLIAIAYFNLKEKEV